MKVLLLAALARAEQAPPDYREALLAAVEAEADALISRGQLPDALDLVEDFREQVAEDARLVYEEGLILNLMGEPRAAERRYREALSLDPGLASAWYDLGGLLLASGQPDEARAAFEQAAAHSASHPKGWAAPLQLALIAAREREGEAMEDWLREALRRGLRMHDLAAHEEWTSVRRDPELGPILERLISGYGEAPLLETWR